MADSTTNSSRDLTRERWDNVTIDGSPDRDATVSFIQGGTTRAVATVSRDRECLEAELALEHSTVAARKK